MNLEEFTHITLAVVEEQQDESYAPTLIVGDEVRIINGIPEGLDHRTAIQDVVRRLGLMDYEFLFGLRTGPHEVTTGHHTPLGIQIQRITELGKGYSISEVEECPWWDLHVGGEQ
ncbi:MAG TPA: hypothetical protein VJ505_09385 [Holophagaceae bacterium]|nr:hypothetical protein [Holophagaceae bacterium]